MIFKGKITYKGNPKKFQKGYGIGFKIEGFEEWLNIFADSEFELNSKIKFQRGDMVDGEYEQKGTYNVVTNMSCWSVVKEDKKLPELFQPADEPTTRFDEINNKLDAILNSIEEIKNELGTIKKKK